MHERGICYLDYLPKFNVVVSGSEVGVFKFCDGKSFKEITSNEVFCVKSTHNIIFKNYIIYTCDN